MIGRIICEEVLKIIKNRGTDYGDIQKTNSLILNSITGAPR